MLKITKPSTFIKIPRIFVNRFTTNLGYIPDKPSNKDLLFSNSFMVNANVGGDVSLIERFKPISNQYNIGSCTANATADAFEAQIARRDNISPTKVKDLSRLFIYWNARNIDTPPCGHIDNGSGIRFAFDSVRRYGVPLEADYPYDTSKVNKKPGFLVYKKAIQNKLKAFYRIDGVGHNRLTQIKQALNAGNPVVFGTQITNFFRGIRDDSVVQKPSSGFIGGHAMVIVGWSESKDAFQVRNSWGESWGNNGYCYMSADYIRWEKTSDLWVPTI